MASPRSQRNALVLTGGGARAAYQVGVLRAISTITKYEKNPFHIVSGYSAGAINGTWLASRSTNFDKVTQEMWQEWSGITMDRVFSTDVPSVVTIAAKWLWDRVKGGMNNNRQITYLLDTTPLNDFIQSRIDFNTLNAHLRSGDLHAVSITAANYTTGHSTTFFSGHESIIGWEKLNRISVRTPLTAEHVMASAAIPMFFQPIQLGDSYYGDGMIRLNAPLSAAVRLGAERMMVIGIRGPSSVSHGNTKNNETITVGEIAGTILNGLFFDSLDADIARMERVNRTLALMSEAELQRQGQERLRHIPLLTLKPTQEVNEFPACELSRLPATLRFLLKGIGLKKNRGADLLTYLSFEPKYIRSLLELGYEDTLSKKDQVLAFFEGEKPDLVQELNPNLHH
ncbi:patatin-like phospholipase family protein [Bdellovibrio sp. HCB337]|uniref:patatin-like phospholipase family protein n=1 Tax=Bdellovibrio sp. HCB337 TaxID=3394358 RepID=UPI0039A69D25